MSLIYYLQLLASLFPFFQRTASLSINSQENVTYAQNLSNSKISSFTITSSVPIQNLLFGTDHIW